LKKSTKKCDGYESKREVTLSWTRTWMTEASIIYRNFRIKGYHEVQKKAKERGLIQKDGPKFRGKSFEKNEKASQSVD
jgi:hypothetical protein